jgi:hypothetical protein
LPSIPTGAAEQPEFWSHKGGVKVLESPRIDDDVALKIRRQ